jgi:hypothetical protein
MEIERPSGVLTDSIVENDPECMSMSSVDLAHSVTHLCAVESSFALDRAKISGEQ